MVQDNQLFILFSFPAEANGGGVGQGGGGVMNECYQLSLSYICLQLDQQFVTYVINHIQAQALNIPTF